MGKFILSRRAFLASAVSATAACVTARRAPAQISTRSPNEKLNIAGIGVGGKGATDVMSCDTENIVALCDVDDRQAARMFEQFPNAKRYKDFRKMLEEMKEIDAVTVSTPDHMHAPAALLAMSLGKHVYVQKPLAHSVAEARRMREAAHRYNVQTQMGNQGNASDGARQICEMIWDGAIGQIREVHCWTDRPIWPQGMAEPLAEEAVPEQLDWDLWLGVAPKRPYNRGYCPFVWRGWWDFGTGALGDMACHIVNVPFRALKMAEAGPTRVEPVQQAGLTAQAAPTMSTLRYDFPARGEMAPVTLYWYDGFTDPSRPKETQNLPPRLKEFPRESDKQEGENGCMFIGDEGVLFTGTQNRGPLLFPEERRKDYRMPAETLPRLRFGDTPKRLKDMDFQHHQEWIAAIKGGPKPGTEFDHSGPLTEMVLLGNVALRCGQALDWDAKTLRVTNVAEANALLDKPYPAGWGPAAG